MASPQALTVRPTSAPPTGSGPVPTLLAAAHRVAIILSGVLAGAILGTWLSEASLGNSAEAWIGYHQAITRAYTQAVPPIGGLALVATLGALAPSSRNPRTRRLVLAALVCLLVGMLVTVFVHFPINAQIMMWQPDAPPADWQDLRARWLTAHVVRTWVALASFVLLVVAFSSRQRETAVVAAGLDARDLDLVARARVNDRKPALSSTINKVRFTTSCWHLCHPQYISASPKAGLRLTPVRRRCPCRSRAHRLQQRTDARTDARTVGVDSGDSGWRLRRTSGPARRRVSRH